MTRRHALAFTVALMLGACASTLDGSFQEVTLKTPGTTQAKCEMDNGVMRWQFYSGQTVKMQRNDRDLKIYCVAPGNKEAYALIDRDLNPWAAADIVTGIVPGVVYDHFSGALYTYPDVITIDFASVPPRPYPAPEYELSDAPKVAAHGIENYDAALAKKDGERNYIPAPARRMSLSEIMSRSHPLGESGSSSSSSSYGAY